MLSKCGIKVKVIWTFDDFALGRHPIAAELEQTADATEMFDLSEQRQALLQLPFTPAAVALCYLKGAQ